MDLRHSWRALGNLGWALLIWGNFFTAVNLIVFSGTFPTFAYYFYGIGVALIVVTITLEAALNLPFALIGSFVDVLSYIRLQSGFRVRTLRKTSIRWEECCWMLCRKTCS